MIGMSIILMHSCYTLYDDSNEIRLKYVLLNSNGHSILSNDGTSENGSEPIAAIKATSDEGMIDFQIGQELNLYEEVIEHLNIETLLLWIDSGNGFVRSKHSIGELDRIDWTAQIEESKVKKLLERSEEIKSHKRLIVNSESESILFELKNSLLMQLIIQL